MQQRLVRPDDLREALSRRGPCRWRGIIVESFADAEGGMASLPERDFDLIRRRVGLPEPTRQRIVRRRDGRYDLDVAWLLQRLVIEVHGVQHLEQPAWDLDLDRIGDITAAGERVLQLTSYAVRHHAERVGAQLLAYWQSA